MDSGQATNGRKTEEVMGKCWRDVVDFHIRQHLIDFCKVPKRVILGSETYDSFVLELNHLCPSDPIKDVTEYSGIPISKSDAFRKGIQMVVFETITL